MASVGMDWEDPEPPVAAAPVPVRGLFDLSAASRTVLRRLPGLVIFTALGAGLGFGGWTLWPARYTATALIMVDPRTPRTSAIEEALPGIGGDGAAIASIAEIATSDGALVPLVAEARLGEIADLAGKPGATDADVAANLRRGLKVARRGLTYVIEVSMAARDAGLAARLANLVAEDVVRRQTAIRTDAVTGVSDALGARLADLREAALASEKAVSDYRQAHGLLDVTSDASVGQRRLAALTQQSATLRAKLEEAKSRAEELRRSTPENPTPVARSEVLATLRAQQADEARQAAELERTFGPRHPRVDQARQRLATLADQIRAETNRLGDQAKAEVDQLARQLAAIEADISKWTREELSADQAEVALRDLMRRAQSDRQIYEQFLARQKATREQPGITLPETRIVSPAQPPQKPDKPAVAAAVAVGGLVGLLAGLARVVALETRRPPAPPEPAPAPSVPATVPEPRFGRRSRRDADDEAEPVLERPRRRAGLAASTIPVAALAPTPTTPDEPPPATAPAAAAAPAGDRLDPDAVHQATGVPVVVDVAAADRRPPTPPEDDEIDLGVVDLRDAVARLSQTLLPHLGDRPGAALIVTDVPGAEGRTALALALARRVEEAGHSALIVTDHGDAATVEPSLADLLGRDDPGLDAAPPETAGRVSVIAAAGDVAGGFWALTADPHFPQAIARLREDFDLVVLECPAPRTMAASLGVAATDDVAAVLLVADPAASRLDRIREFADLWRRDDHRLVMIALNRAG